MKKRLVVLVVMLAFSLSMVAALAENQEPAAGVSADESRPTSSALANDQEPKKWMVGTEFDLLPYIFDGYYFSGVVGYDNWRFRYVRTNITTPDFATESGFRDNEMDVNAYILDYYFRDGFEGWWVGPGYETWEGEVVEESSGIKKSYRTDILTLGGGYTFRVNDHFYVNPWFALHIPVGGVKEVQFVADRFDIDVQAELSVKIAFNF